MGKTVRRTLIAGAIVTGAFMDIAPISKAAPAEGSGRFQRAPVQGKLNSNVKPRALDKEISFAVHPIPSAQSRPVAGACRGRRPATDRSTV